MFIWEVEVLSEGNPGDTTKMIVIAEDIDNAELQTGLDEALWGTIKRLGRADEPVMPRVVAVETC